VLWWGSKGGKETKFFCVWGVIGKTHGLPRAPSSRELSAKLTEGAAERSEADEDKKPAAAPAPVLWMESANRQQTKKALHLQSLPE
jgi:hypothetical protein